MSVWDTYEQRISVRGRTRREAAKIRETRLLNSRLKDSLSFHNAIVDGEERSVAIINSDNLNEKTMFSLPGEDFTCGGLVEWMNNHWLISEKDANNEIYTRVKLLQCNYLLKWVDEEDVIHEQWCMVEDGTKYLTGIYEDPRFIVVRGDSRIAIHIGRNADTVKLKRDNRFIIDDPEAGEKMAYLLTKPLRFGKTYNLEGIYSFVLQETVTTDYDNTDLCIADYYKHFPKEADDGGEEEAPPPDDNDDTTEEKDDEKDDASGKKVWL